MITGIFIEESSNRFICKVSIDGIVTECYVSSSSKLSRYMDLTGKTVMLVKNHGKRLRTEYTLQAVKYRGRWVLLNLNIINDLYYEWLMSGSEVKASHIQRESLINNYKTDFYDAENNCLIELKGLLSDKSEVIYPDVSCGRMHRQLEAIIDRLQEGYKVEYGFVLMSPLIKTISLTNKVDNYSDLFKKCIELGMTVQTYSIVWHSGKCSLKPAKIKDLSIS